MSPGNAANAWGVPENADPRGPHDLATAATVVLDAHNTVIGWSPAAEALLGHPGEAVVGQPVDMLLGSHPADPGRRTAHDLVPSGSDTRMARHRDGHALQVVLAVCPLTGGGPAARILLIAELESVRLSETRRAMLHGLTTQSAIGLAVYDTQLRLTWANTAHDHEVGRPLAEYRGRTADELFPDGTLLTADGRTLNDVMHQVIDTGEPVIDLHFRGKLPSDPEKDHVWSCSYYRLLDADGHVLGVCEDAFDITERYEAQNRLALLVAAGGRIGTTLDMTVTAQEIADVAVPDFADAVTVDLERAVLEGGDPGAEGAVGSVYVRVAARCAPRAAADDTALLLVSTRQLGAGQVALWELPAEPVVVGRARELVTGQLDAWGLAELSFATELVVRELVTNAVRYAGGPLQLCLIRDRSLLCEVADAGHTSPHLRHSTVEDEGGRGLFIVAQLVQRWGTRYTSSGKIIWTEQEFPAGA